MDWLKENWFRVIIAIAVILVAILIFLNRFEFLHLEGNIVIRCSNISGECEQIRAYRGEINRF